MRKDPLALPYPALGGGNAWMSQVMRRQPSGARGCGRGMPPPLLVGRDLDGGESTGNQFSDGAAHGGDAGPLSTPPTSSAAGP